MGTQALLSVLIKCSPWEMKLCAKTGMIVLNSPSSSLDLGTAHPRASLEQQSRPVHVEAAFIGLGKEGGRKRSKCPCLGPWIIWLQLRNKAQWLFRQHIQCAQRTVGDEAGGHILIHLVLRKNVHQWIPSLRSIIRSWFVRILGPQAGKRQEAVTPQQLPWASSGSAPPVTSVGQR